MVDNVIAREQEMLTFALGEEHYGVFILNVKEIVGMMPITRVPNTPSFIKGIVNLRGNIIPIMDIRLKFGIEEIPYNERTCIIIIQINVKGKGKLIGVVVDAVSEVVNILAEDVEPPPEYGIQAEDNFIVGIGKVKNKVIIILDIDKVVKCPEMVKMLEKQGK